MFSDLLPILVCLQLPWLSFSGKNLRCWMLPNNTMLPHLVPTMDPTAALQLWLISQSLSSLCTANQNLLTKNKTIIPINQNVFKFANSFFFFFCYCFLRFDVLNIRQSRNIIVWTQNKSEIRRIWEMNLKMPWLLGPIFLSKFLK